MTELEQFIADAEKHQQFDDIPTLCAMLKAAIEALRAYAGCCDGCTCGDGWSHDAARETLADINTLATEALGTKGARDE